jgi:hypothetical protein
MISSKARSSDSDSIDSKEGADSDPSVSARPSMILFSKADFRTFDTKNPPADIHHRPVRALMSATANPGQQFDSDTKGWISPNKKRLSSLKQVTPPPIIATDNPFSPLQE